MGSLCSKRCKKAATAAIPAVADVTVRSVAMSATFPSTQPSCPLSSELLLRKSSAAVEASTKQLRKHRKSKKKHKVDIPEESKPDYCATGRDFTQCSAEENRDIPMQANSKQYGTLCDWTPVRPTSMADQNHLFVIRNTFIHGICDEDSEDFLEWPAFSDPTNGGQQRCRAALKQNEAPPIVALESSKDADDSCQSHLCNNFATDDEMEWEERMRANEVAKLTSPPHDVIVAESDFAADDTDTFPIIHDAVGGAHNNPQPQICGPPFAVAPAYAFNSFYVPPPALLWPVGIVGTTYGGEVPTVALEPRFEQGCLHKFHREVQSMGKVSDDFRRFTKEKDFDGRLSVVTESGVHTGGVHRYLVQFASGKLSKADGVGFVFSSTLPCKKNIQRIVSIFINQRGRICMRVCEDILRASAHVKPLKCGDWVEMVLDLNQYVASFSVWPEQQQQAFSSSQVAEFDYGRSLEAFYGMAYAKNIPDLSTGHLACVVKNEGVTLVLGS